MVQPSEYCTAFFGLGVEGRGKVECELVQGADCLAGELGGVGIYVGEVVAFEAG